ncbi:ketoacyl-ACP synthase III [Membranicola marinus]|uniref:Beta-ketoacyl-[acyl-carrier-protein] synthase III n=1 Tax=Membranihabitans marinus TaxID=1227546 RepID=A0A953HS16_9BACT|nr:beta-ketoacyl-ACP synthase III [Membranihabitans marinus]MBY5957216.1 ketoacyl-ACP synthase III [Membranihabitans marinus]
MKKTIIKGIGHYVPENIVTNKDLEKVMDTSDEWIRERTGIQERRVATRFRETTTTMGAKAAEMAIKDAGIDKNDIDFIVFATLSPDYYFPGCGVLVQRMLGISEGECGALDIRNQCSGFIYGLSVADQFIKTGMYKNILLIGSETHSMGLDYTTRGRDISVIFGDGAGAVVLQPTEDAERGILSTHLHSDGRHAEKLAFISPGCHGGYYEEDTEKYGFSDNPYDPVFLTEDMLDNHLTFPYMDGQHVFKFAVTKFPEVIQEALLATEKSPEDISLLIPHQANLRISQFVQKRLGLSDDQVYNNIQKYGNTTAASIPIALSEAYHANKIKSGDLVCLAAFGSGFTWGAALLQW